MIQAVNMPEQEGDSIHLVGSHRQSGQPLQPATKHAINLNDIQGLTPTELGKRFE